MALLRAFQILEVTGMQMIKLKSSTLLLSGREKHQSTAASKFGGFVCLLIWGLTYVRSTVTHAMKFQ